MTASVPEPTFTVIIPLEFHRGQTDACVRAWTRQRHPRTDYQILVAAPDGLPAGALRSVQGLLGEGDRIIRRPERHDVPLCAAAAHVAAGAVLFFTEAHCVPELDVLAVAARALSAHPEWSGFSVASDRVVHNRLSVIEADLYEADIAVGMAAGHWRKVLDQGFIIRRDAYFAAGGLDPTLGHFSEWMLAARCHRMGMTLGYEPQGRIHHLYPGNLRVWREFNQDFVRGEIVALARGDADGLIDLFGFVPEWNAREAWSPATARRMVEVCLRDALAGGAGAAAAALRWLPAALGAHRLRRVRARVRDRLASWRVRWHTRVAPLEVLRASVLGSMGALAHAERLRAIAACRAEGARPPSLAGAWEAGRSASLPTAGLHPPEGSGAEAVVWSERTATIHLPLGDGRHDVLVEWRPGLAADPAPRFYLNERAITGAEVRPSEGWARMAISVPAGAGARLAWVCRGRAIGRRSGLPLRRISWHVTASSAAAAAAASRAAT